MKARILVLTFIVISLIAINTPLLSRLTITDARSGHTVFQGRLDSYREFYISFTHSVNKTPVNEYYRISGDGFMLEKAVFYSYGAGMPEAGEYGSDKPIIKDGMVQINGINKAFKRFTYVSGTYAKHSLNTDKSQISFQKFVKPQTPVTFEVKRISLYTMLRLCLKDNHMK